MRILVIGGTGFIGPHVVRYLHNMGHEITLFHRGETEADLPPDVKHILGDRHRLGDFSIEFKDFAPDVVLDMFPFSGQDAQTLMSTLKRVAHRIVALSSQDVYHAYGKVIGIESGPAEPIPLTEDAPLRERLYPYRGDTPRDNDDPNRWLDDYDKIPIEQTVMSDPDSQGTILRLPMVFGPGDKQHRLFKYVKRIYDNRPTILLDQEVAGWRATRGYVENVAAAIATAVADKRSADRIYNVGDCEAFTMADWVVRIGQAAAWGGEVAVVPVETLPSHLVSGINTDQDLVVDTTRIRRELDYKELVDLNNALIRTIAWEISNPPADIAKEMFDYITEDTILADLKRRDP